MTEIAYDMMSESLNSLNEDEALSLIYRLQTHFGFSGTMFCRADVESEWRGMSEENIEGEVPLPDSVWEAVQESWEWRRGIPELLTERGFELLDNAILEIMRSEERKIAAATPYTVMSQDEAVKHTCWDSEGWEGILMPDECDGCEQAMQYPCKFCGYGGAFTTHAPEAHWENGDPHMTLAPEDYDDSWTDVPHVYGDK